MNSGSARGDHLRVLAPPPSTSCGTHVSYPCICVWLHVADRLSLHSGGSFLLPYQSEAQGWDWLMDWWLATQLSAALLLPGLGSRAAFLTGRRPSGRPRLLQDTAPASPLAQPSWTGVLFSRVPGGSPASWWRPEFSVLLDARVWGGFNLLLPRPCLQRLAFSWI